MDRVLTFVEIAVVPVIVATITALGVWLGSRKGAAQHRVLRDENTAQHAEGRALLAHLSTQVGGIDGKMDRIDSRLDDVQIWQAVHDAQHASNTKEGSWTE
jgi:hypothetical protein